MNNFIELFNTENFSIILLLVSFLGGILASIAPCSLAMMPIIVGYVGGFSKAHPARFVLQMFSFIIGMAIVFSLIGVICVLTGQALGSFNNSYLVLILGSFLLVLGLHLVGAIEINFPVLIKQFPQNKLHSRYLYPMLLGGVFAVADSPCATPILAGVMTFATLSKNILMAVLMLFAFSFGKGLILVLVGIFTSKIKKMKNLNKISEILLKSSGILFILSAVYIFYKTFSPFI